MSTVTDIGWRTRIGDVALDSVQRAGVRVFALRGETVARLMTPKGLADPYPVYAQLRAAGEICESKRLGVWLLTSHRLVSAGVRDERLSVDNRAVENYQDGGMGDRFSDHEMILRMDPPDHTRIRRLVGKAFTPKAMASLRGRIEAISAELLDRCGASTGFDVVGDYAVPLTIRVICSILGVPDDEWRRFRAWGDDATRSMGLMVSRRDQRAAEASAEELSEYLAALITRRRSSPGEDLLSAMIAAEEEGDRLSDRELLANAFLILLAGFETTVNLIGNGTMALLSSPNQWEDLCSDPSLVANAVEELLRFDCPVQFTGRNLPSDVELEGARMAKGKQVLILLGSANRDPAVFDDPDRLDIRRANAREHVAFSSGPHYCLGASLARLEGEVAFGDLSRRLPLLRLDGRPVRKRTDLLRGYERVPVRSTSRG